MKSMGYLACVLFYVRHDGSICRMRSMQEFNTTVSLEMQAKWLQGKLHWKQSEECQG